LKHGQLVPSMPLRTLLNTQTPVVVGVVDGVVVLAPEDRDQRSWPRQCHRSNAFALLNPGVGRGNNPFVRSVHFPW
jgi:hypothetical protein